MAQENRPCVIATADVAAVNGTWMSEMSDNAVQILQNASVLAAAPLAASTLQWILLAGGIITLVLVMTRQKRRSGSQGRRGLDAPNRPGGASMAKSIQEVGEVMAELDQLSRQIHARIDLKLATLQKLIRDADDRIDTLTRMERRASGQASVDIELESESPDSPVADQGPNDAIYRLADSGYTSLQIARELARHKGEIELILSLRKAAIQSGPNLLRKHAG